MSAMKKKMAAAGSSVLLSGEGGDHLCWSQIYPPPQIADAVKRFRFGRAVRESRLWAEALRKSQSLLLRDAVADWLRRVRMNSRSTTTPSTPPAAMPTPRASGKGNPCLDSSKTTYTGTGC